MNKLQKSLYDAMIKSAKENGIEIIIEDDGIGIPKEAQSKLFSKFFRADNARLRKIEGTGLGLYIAKTIINAHEGEIICRSTEDKGSIFKIILEKY